MLSGTVSARRTRVPGSLRSIGLNAFLRLLPAARRNLHSTRLRAAIGALTSAKGWWRMAARDVATIDRDLKFVNNRRETNRRRISALSAEIIVDTGMIDRLLAERCAAVAAQQASLPASS